MVYISIISLLVVIVLLILNNKISRNVSKYGSYILGLITVLNLIRLIVTREYWDLAMYAGVIIPLITGLILFGIYRLKLKR
ncbi:hypothetical protein [Lactobacillus sp.]|uniref:hypothetical protein n=1 Tax=Lactobacillus sp. TaxID=1591 RepID=UPI0019920941|nr:hypothetical protein [Lactobacillus sp.]MBD5429732.1 hypothetical protein [Lactobacillus sp.]